MPAGDFKNQCCANQLTIFPLHLSVPICVLAWPMAPPPSQNLGDVPDSALGRCSDFQVGETLPMPPSAYDPPRPPRTLIFPEVSRHCPLTGQLSHRVTSASSQRAIITDVLIFLHYSEFLECRVCPRHKAVPARQKFAEWSEPETQRKAALLGKDWLGRHPRRRLKWRCRLQGSRWLFMSFKEKLRGKGEQVLRVVGGGG